MNIKKLTLKSPQYPEILRNISGPPDPLFYVGADLGDLLKRPRVAIVGTRRVTPYGEQVTLRLARELAEQGDRSLSAEIRIAVREHVRNELRAETSTELQDEL